MGRKTSVNKFTYGAPDPFTLPAVRLDGISRETLHYSAKTLEEIMYKITEEFKVRGMTLPIWKRYKSSLTDYDSFNPDPNTGATLHHTALKWFPQYILDLQVAIDQLISDPDAHDTRKAYLARVFCNNTSPGMRSDWNTPNKLFDGITVIMGASTKKIHPLAAAISGQWPFNADYLKKVVPIVGITPSGVKQVYISTTDPSCPKSPISNMENGKIGGLSAPMTTTNRPTSNRVGADGKPDYDEGYGYLGHLALAVQQVRYQPPVVENWSGDVAEKDYVSNLYSRNTPNLAWYLAQPVEQFHLENWGYWLLGGRAGVSLNRLKLRAYDDPIAQVGEEGHCIYSVFFPPSTAPCSCGYASNAWAMWWANECIPAKWDELEVLTTGTPIQQMKSFGRHTKLKISVDFSVGGGENTLEKKFYIQIKTNRIGITSEWLKIYECGGSYSGIIQINLMEKLHQLLPNYQVGGIDSLMQVRIVVTSSTHKSWEVNAIDIASGSILPNDATTKNKCTNADCTLYVNYILLDEEMIAGDPVNSYS